MIVIFEGHDRAGKSTIAKSLALKHNGIYIADKFLKKAVKQNVNQSFARYQLALFAKVIDPTKLVIVDRALLSHLVYSKVFGNPACSDVDKETERLYKKYNILNIICYKDGAIPTDDLFDKQDQVRKEFLSLDREKFNIVLLNTSSQDLESQLTQVWSDIYAFFSDKV